VLLASLDTNRPAAMEQLAILGAQIGVDTLPIVKGESAVQIAKRAKTMAALGAYDVVFLDTAGRLHIDEVLMDEIQAVRDVAGPRETLLVVDGLTGQDAVNVAAEFDGKVGISGVVLTRMDGDGRGGAALSMRQVTGKPIRFVGLGEKMDALETFEAERVAGRILGMGDIVALVERARETFEAEAAERMAKRFAKGLFNMNDLKSQLDQMLKMGGMAGMMGMMPGMGGMAKKAEAAGINDKMLVHQIALIQSMTKKERANPDLLAASRKKRIAAGAGLEVSDLNKLLKQHQQMADMMKKMGKGGMMKQAIAQMMGKGGMPDPAKMSPDQMAELAKGMGQGMGMGGMGGLPRGLTLPAGLSGMMKKK
jgi:signal recognition particle subunit SRP54